MFPYSEASWSVVDGAMFMGWGSALPGIATLIAAAICVFVLGRLPIERTDSHTLVRTRFPSQHSEYSNPKQGIKGCINIINNIKYIQCARVYV